MIQWKKTKAGWQSSNVFLENISIQIARFAVECTAKKNWMLTDHKAKHSSFHATSDGAKNWAESVLRNDGDMAYEAMKAMQPIDKEE